MDKSQKTSSDYPTLSREALELTVTSQNERIKSLNEKIEKLEGENKSLKKGMDIRIPSLTETKRILDMAGITESIQFLALAPSKKLRAVTERSIADLFINFGVATSRFFTVIKERVWKVTNAGFKDYENEREIIGKNEFLKCMEDAFDLPKDLANIR